MIMRLIPNQNGEDHRAAIRETLEGAEQISLAVAYLKVAGADLIVPLLRQRLKQSAKAEAFIGTGFFITEPEALKKLLTLRKQFAGFEIFLTNKRCEAFHPKTYVGRKGDRVRCLIGSANLTAGAMETNDEISILTEVGSGEKLATDLIDTFERYRDDPRFERLDGMVLNQYRSNHRKQAPKRLRFEEDQPAPFDLSVLDDLLARYRADREQTLVLEGRRKSRARARTVQNEIADLHKAGPPSRADREALRDKLCDLMSSKDGRPHHWPSSGINRHGHEALSRPKETIAMFAEARRAARRAPFAGYEAVRQRALEIPGVGSNMVTEILCTFNPRRFAVFNGNTAGALRTLGIQTPRSRVLKALTGERYVGVRESIDAVRERLDGADFNEADAFLYWMTTLPRRGS